MRVLLLCGVILWLAGCKKAAPPANPEEICAQYDMLAHSALTGTSRKALVFIDRSSSAVSDEATRRIFVEALKKHIEDNLWIRNSEMRVFFVHGRTTGRADVRVFRQGVSVPNPSPYDLEQKEECLAYREKVRDQMRKAYDSLQTLVALPPEGRVARATDLWGILEVISEEASSDTSSPPVYVLVLSDLLECMPGAERRCFEEHPPGSRTEAEAWAREDAKKLVKMYRISLPAIRRARYTFISGTFANREASRYVRYYWLALLEALGVPSEHIKVQ